MNNFDKIIVSFYKNIYSTNSQTISLHEALLKIQNDEFRDIILDCRKFILTNDIKSYKASKIQLPAVAFSGLFSASRKSEALVKYSNLLVIDVDGINSSEVQEIKMLIASDKHIFASWISPSGKGVKALISVISTQHEHKQCFDALYYYFFSTYNISIDKSGSDICRLCFFSHDKDLIFKPTSVPFDFNLYPVPKTSNHSKTNLELKSVVAYQANERRAYYDTSDRNNSKDRHAIGAIIKYLKKRRLSITNTYENWYRVALSIADTFTLEIGLKYYMSLCELDGELHDEYKSAKLLEYCYRNRRPSEIKFATIVFLAQAQGFKFKNSK
ncbi:BT4734/BF3469 family protein [Spirosoma endophyticum]|uniref:VirE N-terminal domain-containing protein n=1 Tax=Spirosoma endophyticum TaxID=662367 RepID=A0A1I1X7C3_9BACT|nr:BT4734/BF3469 family protein [Spirosoma endophyticum]SFE03294.1 VirE N-terminal domain-containing protein [Spirosoma endophyticum]